MGAAKIRGLGMLDMHICRSMTVSFPYTNDFQSAHEVYKGIKAQCSIGQLTLSASVNYECVVSYNVVNVKGLDLTNIVIIGPTITL